MNYISKEALQRIREEYPVGARVELTKMLLHVLDTSVL